MTTSSEKSRLQSAIELGCDCLSCPFRPSDSESKYPILPKLPRKTPKLALIDEAPRKSELIDQHFFAGRKDDFLAASFTRLVYNLNEVYYSSALLCPIPKEATPKDINRAVESCSRRRIGREFEKLNLNIAMPLGNLALQSVTKHKSVSNYHGAPQESHYFKDLILIPSFHPRFVMAKPAYTPVFLIHLERAWDYVNGTFVPWEWPKLVSSFHSSPAEIDKALSFFIQSKTPVSCDVETTVKPKNEFHGKGTPRNVQLLNIGFGNADLMFSLDVTNGLDKLSFSTINLLRFLLKRQRLIFQNGIFDLQVLVANKLLDFSRLRSFDDTMIQHAVCAPSLPHSLAFICGVEFNAPRWKEEFGAAKGASDDMSDKFANAVPELRALYNARDNYMQFRLYEKLKWRLENQIHNGPSLYASRIFLAREAAKMTTRGVHINEEARVNHQIKLTQKVEEAKSTLKTLTNNPDFNPNATKDVATSLLAAGAPILKYSEKTKQVSYTGDTLITLSTYPEEKVALLAGNILRYRKYKKLLSTYVEKLPIEIGEDNLPYVHPIWNVTGAKSGRWSAQKPNLMNVPKPSKLKVGGKILELPGMRDIIKARPGHWFVEFDASALELRIIALLAQDAVMIEDFSKDLHTINAAMLFGKQPKLWDGAGESGVSCHVAHVEAYGLIVYVTDKERDFAKRFVYGSNYGGAAKTIWKALVVDFPHLSVKDVERALRKWAEARPLVAQWKIDQVKNCFDLGFVEAPLSGRRWIFYGKPEATKALNGPMQMTAIDILDAAMQRAMEATDINHENLTMQVHDSLVFETNRPFWLYDTLSKVLPTSITIGNCTCPFPFDGKIGKDWGNMKKLKEAKQLWPEAA